MFEIVSRICELTRDVSSKPRWPLVVLALAGCIAVLIAYAWLFGGREGPELEPPECQPGPTVPGIDVSYYQDTIDWKQVRRAGVRFAFIRVSDGTTVPDSLFAQNWGAARRAGVLRGAYQYFRPDQSATAQADLVIAAVKRDRGELPPVIDVETDGGRSPAQLAQRVEIWVTRVRSALGVEPIIYTGPEFWRDKAGGADLTTQPLWVAHYTARCPTTPAPWTAWTFWQYSDRGTVPGITRPVDLDVFAGSLTDLEDFARRSRRKP
ncbi:MAG: Lyzozyme (1,4-beta-N-acetylmuramidase) [Deltaproteobacteria bacterium]|nr:Lyzozyme (1,4-beta-N-acetylmuramidase) [Deltaproteobacteria bacterium]